MNSTSLSVTDAKGQTIRYAYDERDRLVSMTDQLGRTETYGYDLNDNLTRVTDRKGQATTYAYDRMNRVTRVDYGDGSYTTYTYDAVGRLVSINDSVSGPIEYVYSDVGCSACGGRVVDKVIRELTPLGSVSYEYDVLGRRTKMQVAGQEPVTYQYDANGRLTGVSTWSLLNGTLDFDIEYDALGRRVSLTYPNGVTTNYAYDDASRLLTLKHLNALNLELEVLNYLYDRNGNRTSMDRLNIIPELPNPVSDITYNQANRMLAFRPEDEPEKEITYDENGNMTSMTNGCGTTTYSWDARNRLVGIEGYTPDCSPLTAEFKYDALNRRIEKTINGRMIQYLYDGLDIVQEIEDGVVAVNYIRTLNIDEPLARIEPDGTIRYYQADALGSVIGLTDDNGNVVTQYSYSPFGEVTISGEISDNPFQYTGRENDGTGLYYYRARYYSPEMKRFISEDPIRFAGGISFYVYVGNSPVNWRDPSGLYVGGVGLFGGGGISGNVSPGIFGTGSASLVWDQYGNFGWAVCGGVGVAAGSGVMGGGMVTNAWGINTICGLESSGVGAGAGGAGGGGGIGGGGFAEVSSGGIATGVGVGIGGWAGYSGAGGCKVYPLYPGGSLKCKKKPDCEK